MQKQILSLAIALPTILFTALPTLANPIQSIRPKVGDLQLGLVPVKLEVAAINQLSNPGDDQVPGPGGGVRPKPPRPGPGHPGPGPGRGPRPTPGVGPKSPLR